MKKIIAFAIMTAFSVPVLADATSEANAGSSAGFQINSPLSVTVTPEEQRITYDGSYTVKNAPSMLAPNITSSNDTCMGSASGAVSGPGFGVAVGSTFTDDNCIMLKNSRELWNMGMRAAALAHMCSDPKVAESLIVTGYQCPERVRPVAPAPTQPGRGPGQPQDWYNNDLYRGG